MKRLVVITTFVAAFGFLLAVCARAAGTDAVKIAQNQQAVVEGVVVPDHIYGRQPFSFAAPQVAQGEVVSIQSVTGVVVQRTATDKYGRVFLAAGLPAGAYLITRSSHDQPLGKIEIHQRAVDALERPWEHPPQPMQLQKASQAAKLNDPFSLSGHGFSPNYADMHVSVVGSGKTEAPEILAATEDQLKLAPLTQMSPGMAELRVTNSATGQSMAQQGLLLYDIQGDLQRRKLTSGTDQTQLVVTVMPKDSAQRVKATVLSGPVDFGGGRKEAEAFTSGGQAIFPVYAERGAGPFELSWALALSQLCDQKKLRDQAAAAEQNAATDHESGAAKKLKCDDKKGAADEYRKAKEDCDRAAEDYDKNHEATLKSKMQSKAAEEENKANRLDPPK
jgi:hypothetical protein